MVPPDSNEAMMTTTRTETDTFGPIEVPGDRYWGAQTERSRQVKISYRFRMHSNRMRDGITYTTVITDGNQLNIVSIVCSVCAGEWITIGIGSAAAIAKGPFPAADAAGSDLRLVCNSSRLSKAYIRACSKYTLLHG